MSELGTVAIIGYGNQGQAQALNLRDSGIKVVVGQRLGKSGDKAVADKFEIFPVSLATQSAKTVMITLPDESMAEVFSKEIGPNLRPGQTLLFSHGFNIHFGYIKPPEGVGVGIVSPKGQARGVRGEYLNGTGVPALVGIWDELSPNLAEHTWQVVREYADACGYARRLLVPTSFREETETDLFGEQTVLCGGVIEIVKAAFEVLIEAGYSKKAAYFECFHELKLIVDLMNREGLATMRASISDTAEYGGYRVGPSLVTEQTKAEMRKALDRIQDGSFANDWIQEAKEGKPYLLDCRQKEASHPIEEVGRELRSKIF